MKEYLFIISTKAGSHSRELKDLIEKEMINLNIQSFSIKETKYKDHAKEMAKDFSEEKKDKAIVIVCGGDGSLNEVANVLAGSPAAMGALPVGTANDFSKSLYQKKELTNILRNFPKGFLSPIDLIKIRLSETEMRYCLNILSFGFDTLILQEAYHLLEKHPKLKSKAYYGAILKSLGKMKSYPFEIRSSYEGESFNRQSDYILGAVCNGSFYGSGFHPNPKGKLNDGKAFLVLLEKTPLYKIPGLILKYKNGRHLSSKEILTRWTQRGVFSSTSNILLNIDGEIYNTKKIEWTVEKEALNFFHLENHHIV